MKMSHSQKLVILGAVISLAASVYFWFSGRQDAGLFVGLWVPSILALGAYLEASRRS